MTNLKDKPANIVSKEITSVLVEGGRRAIVGLGLKRRPTGVPFLAALGGLALSAGAALALVPLARKSLARLRLRAKTRLSDEPPRGNGAGANGIVDAKDGARGATAGLEKEELERAENEGMHPARW